MFGTFTFLFNLIDQQFYRVFRHLFDRLFNERDGIGQNVESIIFIKAHDLNVFLDIDIVLDQLFHPVDGK